MKFLKSLVCILSLSVLTVWAHGQSAFVEGEHYQRLSDSVRTSNPKKVEVVEVFSYHCGHCYTFEPIIQPWKQQLADNVVFVPMQAQWDVNLTQFARAQLTGKALKVDEKVHAAMYRAIQVPGQPIKMINRQKIKEIFVESGVDEAKFEKAFESFGINSQLKQQKEKMAGYKVGSTPTIIVNGEYVVNATNEIDHKKMLEITDYLVAKIKAEKGLE